MTGSILPPDTAMSLSSLPLELQRQIADELDLTKDISALCRTSRMLHSLLTGYLYQHDAQRFDGSALFWAAFHGQIATAKSALEAGVGVNARQGPGSMRSITAALVNQHHIIFGAEAAVSKSWATGWTPLHVAASSGDLEMARFLLEKGAEIATTVAWQEPWLETPVHIASYGGHVDMVNLLAGSAEDIGGLGPAGTSPMHIALCARTENVDLVKTLLRHGASVLEPDLWRRRPLHLAALHRHLELVQMLLNEGAGTNGGMVAPMLYAASMGRLEVVKIFLDNGASTADEDDTGHTALICAAGARNIDLAKLLIEEGASVTAASDSGYTPLHNASANGPAEMVELLLLNGADVAAVTQGMETPLLQAVTSRQTEAAKLLLLSGASATAADSTGRMPIHWASSEGDIQTTKLLLENGADVADTDNRLATPLHCAADLRLADMIRFLIAHGADPTAQDVNGRAALVVEPDEEADEATEEALPGNSAPSEEPLG